MVILHGIFNVDLPVAVELETALSRHSHIGKTMAPKKVLCRTQILGKRDCMLVKIDK
jgi:hypothetical protein